MPVNVSAILRTALRQLESERDRLDRQTDALRAALNGGGAPAKVVRQRRPMRAAARRAVSRRMKAYWAKRRRAAGTKT
jgi:hypothetical protein